ncbi:MULTISPECIES: ABC transporter ATP-binding protein [Mesorhizobium]|uniref:ABC transporter ATP-binding protein n=1 Tax=Mesorhizobium denitrificans TaxID=2294114 RepID=A0A371XGW3_9HYPH|nr:MULTISPECIES: ABC transporter ATP-binding protein [Mesorhizobium]RFC68470.1 ABC transporter ATP-binding protein [Mesorhizobium denitrificans]
MTPLLEITKLTVSYDGTTPALHEANLTVAAGERVGLIGESGSGKSTLALAIAGLLPRTARVSGSIRWQQTDTVPRKGTDIGYVFQDPAGSLDPVMRIGAQLAEILRVLRGKQSQLDVPELLARVGFPDPEIIAARYPHQLSGGQKQRVAIACALAGQPRLLIADEATSALDTIVQAGIVRLLSRLTADTGSSLLFITHDLALASTLADRLVVMRNGRILEAGTPREIIEHPRHPYVASLVASHLALEGPTLLETQREPAQ